MLRFLERDPLLLWRECKLSEDLTVRTIGRRYLRLDSKINGFARLSPSILREFLTYSVIGLSTDPLSINVRIEEVELHIREVSKAKYELARHVFMAVMGRLENDSAVREHACVLIAGDIVYGMAHDVPRPERSTGKLVRGSDIDLVVIVDDEFSKELMEKLDEAIYREKQSVLMTPHLREEIDYVVKDLPRVKEQLRFDTFKRMVACKIMHEASLLYGNNRFFTRLKGMLSDHGVTEKIHDLRERAIRFRESAEEYLLEENDEIIRNESLHLFYPTEESEEFE